ncbi:hypothetical protein ACS0TY_004216 [Phlomoides rotata]
MFFSILSHHTKNRSVTFQFRWSEQTVSKYNHEVLRCVLKLHNLFLVHPQPVPDDSTDTRWAMDNNVVGGNQDRDRGKATKGLRTWSRIEEDALVQCLTDIMNDGWKVNNSFRCGFQRELEKGMQRLLPDTDIVANPYINSKIHVWKKEYGALSDLLSKSGIGWNSTTNTIDVLDETVWDAQKRIDPKVVSIRHKSWSYYESWLDIFGKDRATEEHVADPIDIVNELMMTETEEEGEAGMKMDVEPKETGQVAGDASVCKTSGSRLNTGLPSDMALLVDTLGEFMKSTDDSFNSLVNRKVLEP